MRWFAGIMLFVVHFMMVSTSASGAQSYFVQSAKVKVLRSPSFSAEIIDIVYKGYEFRAGDRAGSWIKVTHKGLTGYVPALLVSTRPPMDKVRIIRADEGQLSTGVRRRASTYTSAAAARGLAEDDRRRLSADEKANYTALERMEAFAVSDAEITSFLGARP